MMKISVENACSFAHSVDEDLSNPEQFFEATAGWLKEHQPVLARLSHEMAMRLCGEETAAAGAQAVVGYMLRLIAHAEANQDLRCRWAHDKCPDVCFPFGEPTDGERKYCCKREPDAIT